MKNKFCLKTICFALILSILLTATCFASGEIFGKIGYTDDTLKSFAKDSVILRINNNTFLYDNVDREFSLNIATYNADDVLTIKVDVSNTFATAKNAKIAAVFYDSEFSLVSCNILALTAESGLNGNATLSPNATVTVPKNGAKMKVIVLNNFDTLIPLCGVTKANMA